MEKIIIVKLRFFLIPFTKRNKIFERSDRSFTYQYTIDKTITVGFEILLPPLIWVDLEHFDIIKIMSK